MLVGTYNLMNAWSPLGSQSCCYPNNNQLFINQTSAAGNATLSLNWTQNNQWCQLYWPNYSAPFQVIFGTTAGGGYSWFNNFSVAYFPSNVTIGLFFDGCAMYFKDASHLFISILAFLMPILGFML